MVSGNRKFYELDVFHKLGSPKWFYEISGKWVPWLLVSSGSSDHNCSGLGLAFAPPDYLQGNSYRIIFIHVPSSFLAQAIYMMMAAAGAVTLIWRVKLADMSLAVMAPIGASFVCCHCLLVLSGVNPPGVPGGSGMPG